MGDPGNPTDPTDPTDPTAPSDAGGPGSDPGRPGWASPTPPPPPPPPEPSPPPPPPPVAAAPPSFGAPPPPNVPGGVPPNAGWEPPAPPVKKRKLTWLWILIPVLLVFAASVVLIAVFAVRAIVGPIETTDNYFSALRDERYSEAYDLRCASFQAQIGEAQFALREQTNGPVRTFDINGFERHNNSATTDGEVTRGGIRYQVTVRLEKEDGDWKICTIEAQR
jgi:hypothetical protein